MMTAQKYWNDIGAQKVFEDPLYLDKFSPFLSPTARILEYGCGYGRMMKTLKQAGYHNLIGFDFAPNMIARGFKENPDLDLRLLEKAGIIPCNDESIDAIVMSTVLCCITDEHALAAFKSLHNFASHAADAFRMMTVSLNKLISKGLSTGEWNLLRYKYIA